MSRGLRSAGQHAGTLTLLLIIVAASATGIVAGTGGSHEVLISLVLLTTMTAGALGTDLTRRRRRELSVARLRGVSVLAAMDVGPLLLAVLGGAGLAQAGAAARGQLTGSSLAGSALVAGVALVVVLACLVGTWREPLAEGTRRPGRPARRGTPTVAAGVAFLVAAAIAAFQAGTGDRGAFAGAAPTLLGVAAGQLVVVLRHLGLRVFEPVAGDRSTATLLGVRLGLAPGAALRVRAAVAAGVVAVSACTGAVATTDWASESGALQNSAALSFSLPDTDALQALQLTRRIDPAGRWVMAAVVDVGRVEVERRVAWLDLERYERVVGSTLDGTSGDLTSKVSALRAATAVDLLRGDELAGTPRDDGPARVGIELLTDRGYVETYTLDLPGVVELPACREGCVLLAVTAAARDRTNQPPIATLNLDDHDLLGTTWVRSGAAFVPASGMAPMPVAVAGDATWGLDGPTVPRIDTVPRPAEVVAERTGLPVVEGAGLVADLPVALAASRGAAARLSTRVLARSDVPDDVRSALSAAGASEPTTLDAAVGRALDADSATRRDDRWVLAAVAALLMLMVLLGGAARRRQESARLRSVQRLLGLSPATLRKASLTGLLLTAATTAIGVTVGAWVVLLTAVDGGDPVPDGPTRLPLGGSVTWLGLLFGAAVSAAMIVLTTPLGRRRPDDPAALLPGHGGPDGPDVEVGLG